MQAASQPNPWPLLEVPFEQAQPRIGRRTAERTVHYAFRGDKDPFGVMLYWRRPTGEPGRTVVPPFLTVRATFALLSEPHKRQPFKGREGIEPLLNRFQGPPMPMRPEHRNAFDFQVADPSGAAEIVLEFTLDTNNEEFLRLADQHLKTTPDQPFVVEVSLYLFDIARRQEQSHLIRLQLPSCKRPGWDDGLVGIDLGHNSTSLTWLPELGENTSAIQVLSAGGSTEETLGSLAGTGDPVESNLSITHVELVQPRKADKLDWCRWEIGTVPGQSGATGDNTLFSVKRMLAERAVGQAGTETPERRLVAYRTLDPGASDRPGEINLSTRLPSELFFCRLFQRFREAKCRSVKRFAATYPTTFSLREVSQVREAVYRGWLRSLERPQQEEVYPPDDEKLRTHFPLVLDEASAAGYYFLHKEIFEKPHGLARFRYLYPEGFNLLLFDCGGGTIDIGILRAELRPGGTEVEIRVVGRTGMRSFGGDNITEAIYRLLKAKIAVYLAAEFKRDKLAAPGEGESWREYLRQQGPTIERVLPTQFNPEVYQDSKVAKRREAMQALWGEAERIKKELSIDPKSREQDQGGNTEPTAAYQHVKDSVLDRYFQSLGGAGVTLKADRLNKIDITRSMVDELIGPSVRESVARCNYLIHHKLTLRDQEVHRVVMAGNGSRYRMFAEEMGKQLAVPQLDRGRMYQFAETELADLKHAVAKGVTLALARGTRSDNVRVTFDHKLSERIPFTLAYKDSERKQFIPLLGEDERYDKLVKDIPRLQIQPRPGTQNEVILYRHWPGDLDAHHKERFWPYQVYRFRDTVKGDIRLRYDAANAVFVLYTQQEEAKLITELVEDVEEEHLWRILASPNPQLELRKVYYSPLQRGVL